MIRCLNIFTLLLLYIQGYTQYPRVEIPGSEVRKITSSIVSGQEYELHILLPTKYKSADKKFPVVYLMDSQWDFPLVKSIYGQQYYDGFIPELIIVGVTWGGVNPNADSLRVRDYTPTNDGMQKQSGGADKFLSFMRNELFPFIESNYKADDQNRTIVGCSLGGLITMYALFSQPDMFTGYAAASPAIGWDREVLYKYEKKYSERKVTSPARLYMTIGGVERNVSDFEKMATFLDNRNYTSLKIKQVVLENTGHSGTKSETYSRGLQYIFDKPRLNLDATVLNKYVGAYESGNNNKIEITNVNGGLFLCFSPTRGLNLFASSETEFYSRLEFFNVSFRLKNGEVEGFQLDRFNNSQFIKKTK